MPARYILVCLRCSRFYALNPISRCQLLANCPEFASPRASYLGIAHFKVLQRIDDDTRNDQPCVLLVIGWHNVPWRGFRAGSAQTVLVSPHVLFPEFPLGDVILAEFPVLVRFINAQKKALSLLLLRQVKEDRLLERFYAGCPFFQPNFFSARNTKVVEVDFHIGPSALCGCDLLS